MTQLELTLLIAGLVLLAVLFFFTLVINSRLVRLTKRYKTFMKGKDVGSMEKSLLRAFQDIETLKTLTQHHDDEIQGIIEHSKVIYEKMAILKYDAFQDMGGKISFVIALLNRENSGFVMNVIHGQDTCHTYMKEIVKGESYLALSEEELKALQEAAKK